MPLSRLRARIASFIARPVDRLALGLDHQSQLIDIKLEKIVEGVKNQSDLINKKLGALIEGVDNQSRLLDARLQAMIVGIDNLSKLLNNRFEKLAPCEDSVRQMADPASSAGTKTSAAPASTRRSTAGGEPGKRAQANDLGAYAGVFTEITPWSGVVPKGYFVDFLGTLTPAEFRVMFGVSPNSVGGAHEETRIPSIADGEGWFEAVNWVVAAKEARERFVMVTLGACYGAQAVGSYRALQLLNPMPCKLVAVEPDPENMAWTVRHFRDNGIDPDAQWFVQAALSDTNAPVFFPVGSPGSGAQNCFATNERAAREAYVRELIARGAEDALRNLLLHNSTGITKSLVPGHAFNAEVKLLSSVTLGDILGPFDFVDYLESDIQQSEIVVFPPFMDLLKKKVRRVHIGTHGRDVHLSLHDLFAKHDWEIVFSYEPNSEHHSILGSFKTNDGVLTARNPLL